MPPENLTARIEAIEQTLKWLTTLVKNMLGINSVWVKPGQAASILNLDKEMIMREIRIAELHRKDGLAYPLQYGTHYRNDKDPMSSNATWKINVDAYSEFLKIPPDERASHSHA